MGLRSYISGYFIATSYVGDSIALRSFAGPANAQPPTAVGTSLLTMTNTQVFGGNANDEWVRGAGPFSLGYFAAFTLPPGATLGFVGATEATAIPEPQVPLVLLGLFAIGTMARRRRLA
jgi:hypothetical protein